MIDLKSQILARLQTGGEEFVSGSTLSGDIGVTRAAVWKQVERLRREGYRITARPRRGYRLEKEPDRLNESMLSSAPQVYFFSRVDSTNNAARRLAEQGEPCGTAVLAETQEQGRGRRGRSWHSPPGLGLWFSIILRPAELTPEAATPVTLVAATALAARLNAATGLTIKVKWPNDLLVNGNKIGGILTELKGEPDRVEYLIIGAGINVNHGRECLLPELRPIASSLYLAGGRRFDRSALFFSLKEALTDSCRRFFSEGFGPFRPLWKELSDTLGKEVTAAWAGGSISGRAVDLDPSGALLLRDSEGAIHRVNYGEIL